VTETVPELGPCAELYRTRQFVQLAAPQLKSEKPGGTAPWNAIVVQSIVPHVVESFAVTGMSIVWPKQTGLTASSLAVVEQIWTVTTAVSVQAGL
jgi:hypothetical protein